LDKPVICLNGENKVQIDELGDFSFSQPIREPLKLA